MNISDKVLQDAYRFLAEERNRDKAANRLRQKGLPAEEASLVINLVHASIKAGIRKQAFMKMIGGAIALVIFIGVLLATGYLFYIILAVAAFSFLYGLAQLIFATGYEPL